MNDERAANAIDRKIGQRVRSRRLEIGMSQERLAELLGVTFQQVQKYEKGVNRIAASRLFDIAAALDLPAARFFEGLASRRAEEWPSRARTILAMCLPPQKAYSSLLCLRPSRASRCAGA